MWPACVAVVVCVTAVALFHVLTRETPLDRLKEQIRGELPVGTTRAQVEAWAKTRLNGQIPALTSDPPPENSHRPTLLERAGVPPDRRGSVLEFVVPCGWFTTRGVTAENHMWVLFTLNAQGEVTGHCFLTLEELAAVGA